MDDAYWIDSWDLFREAKQARCMANFNFGAPQLDSSRLVRMLTIDGARALGMDHEVGSLETGKRAGVARRTAQRGPLGGRPDGLGAHRRRSSLRCLQPKREGCGAAGPPSRSGKPQISAAPLPCSAIAVTDWSSSTGNDVEVVTGLPRSRRRLLIVVGCSSEVNSGRCQHRVNQLVPREDSGWPNRPSRRSRKRGQGSRGRSGFPPLAEALEARRGSDYAELARTARQVATTRV